MENDTKTLLNIAVRTSCLVAPPWCFLFLRQINTADFGKTWKDETAGFTVLAWCVAIGCWMWTKRRDGISHRYRAAFISSFVQQAFVLCLAALMLDGGLTLYACILACMLYWMIAGVVIARRPLTPTSSDISWITYGYFLLAFAVTLILWRWCYFVLHAT